METSRDKREATSLRVLELFRPEEYATGDLSRGGWHGEAFARAYCGIAEEEGEEGPFHRICQRLELGFSVLVYLPGNCMTAAAEYVKTHVGTSRKEWAEYGKHPGKGGIEEIWSESSSMVGLLAACVTGEEGGKPNALYHNLNLLSDGRGNLHSSLQAQTAFFSLIEATRAGTVLALSDSQAGRLPDVIEQVFADETVWIDEVAFGAFKRLIPFTLGWRLMGSGQTPGPDDELPEEVAWHIASRLRWSDPIRAVRIMHTVGESLPVGDAGAARRNALEKIWDATRAMGFLSPENAFPTTELRGFPESVRSRLLDSVVAPFERWRKRLDTGRRQASEYALKQLPLGLVLHGPTGTGKTYLARWLARSIGLPIRLVTAEDIKEKGYGDAEKNVHRLFREVRRAAPCIVVLDDADDLVPDRSSISGSVASAEHSIVNAFLQELEGFGGRPAGVLVVLTTNHFKKVDAAIRSRLGIPIRIPFPLNEDQIKEIVDEAASEYGLVLEGDVLGRLVKRFYRTILPSDQDVSTERSRAVLEENLFSAREIHQALRRLIGNGVGPERYDAHGRYRPDLDDVARIEREYEQQEDDGTD